MKPIDKIVLLIIVLCVWAGIFFAGMFLIKHDMSIVFSALGIVTGSGLGIFYRFDE